jgi:hypothetical protein
MVGVFRRNDLLTIGKILRGTSMFKRVLVFAVLSMFILGLSGCGAPEETKTAQEAPPPPPKPVENVPVYELTKDDITSHPDWSSRNISILGVKLGDRTTAVEKNFGEVENTRTLPEDYLTIYQKNGLFVYTFKITGKARRFEVYDTFAKQIADDNLRKLLTSGDLKTMRTVLGMEEGEPIENAEDMATEYPYDSRGIRFVKYKVQGKTLNAIRFFEATKTS